MLLKKFLNLRKLFTNWIKCEHIPAIDYVNNNGLKLTFIYWTNDYVRIFRETEFRNNKFCLRLVQPAIILVYSQYKSIKNSLL